MTADYEVRYANSNTKELTADCLQMEYLITFKRKN
jgi:hypothetical protein